VLQLDEDAVLGPLVGARLEQIEVGKTRTGNGIARRWIDDR